MHDDAHDENQQMALYACLTYTYIIIRVESAEGARERGSFNNTLVASQPRASRRSQMALLQRATAPSPTS